MNEKSRPFWREPMMWLVIALPVCAIVAGVVLLTVAGGSGSTDNVAEDVQRTAQIQTADLGPDERARDLKLSAVVRAEKGVLAVIPVQGGFDRRAPLRLHLRHPTLAEHDVSHLLAPDDEGWRAQVDVDAGHDWNVQLEPENGRWRLQGRLPKGQHAAYLHPQSGAE